MDRRPFFLLSSPPPFFFYVCAEIVNIYLYFSCKQYFGIRAFKPYAEPFDAGDFLLDSFLLKFRVQACTSSRPLEKLDRYLNCKTNIY
jgi:hypothetical protein